MATSLQINDAAHLSRGRGDPVSLAIVVQVKITTCNSDLQFTICLCGRPTCTVHHVFKYLRKHNKIAFAKNGNGKGPIDESRSFVSGITRYNSWFCEINGNYVFEHKKHKVYHDDFIALHCPVRKEIEVFHPDSSLIAQHRAAIEQYEHNLPFQFIDRQVRSW